MLVDTAIQLSVCSQMHAYLIFLMHIEVMAGELVFHSMNL